MYKFNINKIVVNTSEGTKDIVPKTINVFVGPNNSGKSRFLKELRDYLSGDERDIKIIKNIEYSYPEKYGVTYKEKKLWIIDAINRIAELSKDDISSESRLYKFIHRIIENN